MSRRLNVTDRSTGIRYLIDTGADVSVIPRKNCQGIRTPYDLQLTAANGSTIRTYGQVTMVVNIGLRRDFRWRMIVADVPQPILGADFLATFGLLVDVGRKKVLDRTTSLSVDGIASRDQEVDSIRLVSGN
ncbi:hypothetical protein KPH14_002621 [Odynerus spinipes]|uniref:Peptidase A2 domain-containing protein n=1 Tax=Odynerus spinipes TaxID=1348599 RepID=A0AAD9RES3_9HYME|nr:hypothetical protein KPH14_002621 [Odynerus spinipes]